MFVLISTVIFAQLLGNPPRIEFDNLSVKQVIEMD